jgi:hypothetical protein
VKLEGAQRDSTYSSLTAKRQSETWEPLSKTFA